MTEPIRVMVADDHPLFLDGLVATLGADEELEIVGVARDAASAVALATSLGPDLASLGKDVSGEAIVESVLLPSKVIRKGYESVTLSTADGKSLTGLVVERTKEKLVIRDIARGGAARIRAPRHARVLRP